ncbi:MAG: hypothetical protein H0X45_05095 [Planctomycetes bacterium]|nr:hypothetical protein [Planctomycetota bacterium]
MNEIAVPLGRSTMVTNAKRLPVKSTPTIAISPAFRFTTGAGAGAAVVVAAVAEPISAMAHATVASVRRDEREVNVMDWAFTADVRG